MSIVLDIIIGLIVLGFIIGAIHKGGVRSLLSLIGGILVIWAAYSFSGPIAEGLYGTFLQPGLKKQVSQVLVESSNEDLSTAVGKLTESLPAYISGPLSAGGFDPSTFQESAGWAVEKASAAVMSAISKIVTDFVGVIVFLLLILILFIVLGVLLRLLRPVLRLPVLRQLDMVLGFFVGIAQCILFFFVTMAVLHWYLSIASSPPALFSPETIGQTHLFRWIYDWNPLAFFFVR